jgi:hypothetical protein
MYRHALLRLPCEDCGVTHAPSALLLSPAGGWVCRRCQLGREVVAHNRAAAVRARGISPLALVVRLALMVMATGAVIDILR